MKRLAVAVVATIITLTGCVQYSSHTTMTCSDSGTTTTTSRDGSGYLSC